MITNMARIGAFLDNAKSYMFVGGGLAFGAPYCHELGPCTGLPDYYLYNKNDSEGMHGTAGIELMDTDASSDFGAFLKLIEGWYTEDQVYSFD